MKSTRITLAILAIVSAGGFAPSRAQASAIITTETFSAVNVTFSTIPNISATDLAESATFTVAGTLHGASGAIGVLHDGVFPANGAAGSAVFSDTANLVFTLNFGAQANITQINTYSSDSAGSNNRTPQVYTLQGSSDGTTFTTITNVSNNGGIHFNDSFAHSIGNSITDSSGTLGTYQYLRFNTLRLDNGIGTFLDEIDVVGSLVPEPSSVMLLSVGGLLLGRRMRRAGRP